MRIEEIETKMAHGDCSAEMLEHFISALKRVPKRVRCQHCYTTAASMPSQFHKQAISLIQYGLTEHCDSWLDRMRSYHNLAFIMEAHEDYVGAMNAYREALESVESDKRVAYVSEYAAHMMRTEMHISSFEYTDDLVSYYNNAVQADEFSQAFQKKKFYRLLAEIIIFLKRDDFTGAKEAFAAANDMLCPDFVGPLTLLLKRKGYLESTGATKPALAFLHRMKQLF